MPYIAKIEIDALWSGHKHVVWELKPGVNILSGVNGVGKSTILNRSIGGYESPSNGMLTAEPYAGVHLTFAPEGTAAIAYDVIRSTDRPLLHSDILGRITDAPLMSELDWQLYQLQRRYLNFQINISNRILELFTSGTPEASQRAKEMAEVKTRFFDIIDRLFSETGKTIDRTSNEIVLEQWGESLSPYKLSSGEKQMLVILLTALVRSGESCVLFMDEPEISLHIEWQQQLIENIRSLCPDGQIIMTTHSPAVVMNGYTDAVTDVSDIAS